MRPGTFEYHRPGSVDEAVEMLGTLENARPLAGGQSLVPMMNFRYGQFDHLVDLNRIPDLSGVTLEPHTVRIGAMTRQVAMQEHSDLATRMPVVISALSNIGHIATRNRGTIGGSLSHLDPAAELLAMTALHDGVMTIHSRDGERRVGIEDYVQGYMTPAMQEGELLTAVEWSCWDGPHGWAFQEFARRHGDFAIAGVAALMGFDPAGRISRVALTVFGLGPAPVRLRAAESMMKEELPDAALFDSVAEDAAMIEAMDDALVTGKYRRRLAPVLTRRVLDQAADQAGRAGHERS